MRSAGQRGIVLGRLQVRHVHIFLVSPLRAGYMTGVWSLSVVAMASLTALTLTGCLTASEALSCFSNSTVIMVGAMSVVAAGFGRTRFCSRLASWISHVAKGSLSRILLLYCLLTMLLSQMVQSPVIVFGIAAPLCMATADSMHVSRSKLALPLGVVSICTCCTLPVGNGATQAAELNSYISAYCDKLENFTGTMPSIGFFRAYDGAASDADLHGPLLCVCDASFLPGAVFRLPPHIQPPAQTAS